MRAMFGLVSLLVVILIICLIFRYIEAPKLEEGKKAQDQARQISGRGDDGRAAVDSFKIAPERRGNRLEGLLVTDVTPGGAVDTYYGLKKGDRIVQITNGGSLQKIGDASNDDPELAKAQIHNAFQASDPIVVIRNGQQLTLPQSPAQPARSPAPARNTEQDQVNSVLKGLQSH